MPKILNYMTKREFLLTVRDIVLWALAGLALLFAIAIYEVLTL